MSLEKVNGEVHGLKLISHCSIVTVLQPPPYVITGTEQSKQEDFSRVYKSDMNVDKKVQEVRTMKMLTARD